MQNIRSIFLMLAGVTVFVALAFLTFSVTLAVGGILTVLMVGRALSLKMKPAPVRATRTAQAPFRRRTCASGMTAAARSSISDRCSFAFKFSDRCRLD